MTVMRIGKYPTTCFLFLLILAAACSRSATPVLPTAETATTEAVQPQVAQPTPVPTVLPTPTAAVLMENAPLISPANAAFLHQALMIPVENPSALVWSQDGRLLGTMSGSGLVLLDDRTLSTTARVEMSEPFYLLDFSPTSGLMATTVDQKTIELRGITSGEVRHVLQLESPLSTAQFSPDGVRLAVSLADTIAVQLWDAANGSLVKTLTGFQTAAPVYEGSIGEDGKTLIWRSRGTIQLMNMETGVMGPQFQHEDFVAAVALSADGKTLATSAAGTVNGFFQPLIKLWDTAEGVEKATVPAGDTPSPSLSFSPDSNLLASCDDNHITLWDVQAGQTLGAVSGHEDRVSSVAFSPDGKTLASAAYDGTVRLWQATP